MNASTVEAFLSDALTRAEPALRHVTAAASTVDSYFSPSRVWVPDLVTRLAILLRELIATRAVRAGGIVLRRVNLHDLALWQAAVVIFLHPVLWNVIGRAHHATRLFRRAPRFGVVLMAVWIFVVGLYRDVLFNVAIGNQQRDKVLYGSLSMRLLGINCLVTGAILVLSSFYRLGFYGTYLGDYFGILMDEKISKFPFNILEDPMYDGSSLAFLGKAILGQSSAGVILSIWVYFVYRFVSIFEG